MKLTKRQLKRIIKEEKAKLQEMQMMMTDSGQAIYDEVHERVLSLADEVLAEYDGDQIAVEAIIQAISDAAQNLFPMGR